RGRAQWLSGAGSARADRAGAVDRGRLDFRGIGGRRLLGSAATRPACAPAGGAVVARHGDRARTRAADDISQRVGDEPIFPGSTGLKNGRGGEIRTPGLYDPNVALYQARDRKSTRLN